MFKLVYYDKEEEKVKSFWGSLLAIKNRIYSLLIEKHVIYGPDGKIYYMEI